MAIKTILDSEKKESLIELSTELENELLLASEEGRNGAFSTVSEVEKKLEKWLSVK